MIVCKPKAGTYISIAIFETVAGALSLFIYYQLPRMGSWKWLGRLLVPVLLGIMLAILIKVVWSLKVVRVGKEKFEVRYPVRRKQVTYSGKNLSRWKEESIKTAGGVYKELSMTFAGGKTISVSQQEHTNYEQLRKYLVQKFSKVKQ